MAQEKVWEAEYKNSRLVTKHNEPQNDVKRFVRFLKKQKISLENARVLDLGSGTGRNANYFAELGAKVSGLEISKTALALAQVRAKELGVQVEYRYASIGEPYNFPDNEFDVALDVTSSNSLNEKERKVYLAETHRVLKSGSYFFVRALCKDGDRNAKTLLKENHGKEYDTYVMPEMGLVERVFSKEDFIELYSKYFKIIELKKKSSYPVFDGKTYKRNHWLAYLQKD